MSVLLPPYIAIKSSSKYYLNYSDDSDSEKCGFLKLNGDNVFSPLAKFQVVTANTGTGLVHIRCSHNKKFLRAKDDNGASYITPEADEPEEDQSKWSCTLFQPTLVDDKVQFFHVQRQLFVGEYHSGTHSTDNWFKMSIEKMDILYDIIDSKSLVMLPKHVAFKGDNGNYLGIEDQSLLFATTDKGTATAWFEVSTDGHGRAQISSYKTKTFFRYDSNKDGIWADTTNITDDLYDQTTFSPVKVDKNVIALLCFANSEFCGQIQNKAYFNAAFPTISRESHLVLEELVLSRRIYNADFDLANAVIYGETPITMATANASNTTSVDNTADFKFTYTESKSSMWTSSHSWKVGMSVEASFKIPFIGETDVTISGEYSGSYQWGETVTSENSLETTYTAPVPANTSISVSLMATKGICDVPYSYYQQDVLYNGKTVIYKMDDGLYTGVSSYHFKYQVVQTGKGTNEPTTMEQKIVMPYEIIKRRLSVS